MRTAIFDLDGTLLDTSRDMLGAANSAMEEAGHGRPLNEDTDAHVAFGGGRAMIRAGAGLEGAAQERVYQRFLTLYGAHLYRHSRSYPGAENALKRLRKSGFRIAICTNKPDALAFRLTRALGLLPQVDALIGADTLTVRKPAPEPLIVAARRAGGDPDHAVMIGDTVTDREAAKRAGMPCILVRFAHNQGAAEALRPEALLEHYDDIEPLLERLLARAGARK